MRGVKRHSVDVPLKIELCSLIHTLILTFTRTTVARFFVGLRLLVLALFWRSVSAKVLTRCIRRWTLPMPHPIRICRRFLLRWHPSAGGWAGDRGGSGEGGSACS